MKVFDRLPVCQMVEQALAGPHLPLKSAKELTLWWTETRHTGNVTQAASLAEGGLGCWWAVSRSFQSGSRGSSRRAGMRWAESRGEAEQEGRAGRSPCWTCPPGPALPTWLTPVCSGADLLPTFPPVRLQHFTSPLSTLPLTPLHCPALCKAFPASVLAGLCTMISRHTVPSRLLMPQVRMMCSLTTHPTKTGNFCLLCVCCSWDLA